MDLLYLIYYLFIVIEYSNESLPYNMNVLAGSGAQQQSGWKFNASQSWNANKIEVINCAEEQDTMQTE